MDGISSNSMMLMEKSMDFLWAKQTAILDNIANSETPGYKTKTVTFEEALGDKLRAAASENNKEQIQNTIENAKWKVTEADESTRMDDNGVNVTEQSVEMVRTAYQLQYTMQAISSDLTALGTAIRG